MRQQFQRMATEMRAAFGVLASLLCLGVCQSNCYASTSTSALKWTDYDDVGNRFGYNILTDDETGEKTIKISHVQYYTSVLWGNECVNFPAEIEGIKVTTIGRVCHPTHAMTVDIPEGVEEIQDGAFSGCEVLETVALPSTLKSIGMYAFNGCKKLYALTSREYGNMQDIFAVTLPSSVTTVGDYAFANSGIEKVDSLGSIKVLGRGLFYGCANLERVVVPASVSTMYCDYIAYEAKELIYFKSPFGLCSKLEEVYYLGDVPKIVEAEPFSFYLNDEDRENLTIYHDCPSTLISYHKATFGDWPANWNGREVRKCVEISFDPSRGFYCSFPSRVYPISSQFDLMPQIASTYKGMRFLGWFTKPSNCGGTQIDKGSPMLLQDACLYAHWESIEYEVTLDPCGGICDVTTLYYHLGAFYGDLPTPVREDYVFTGWYDSTGKLIYKATQMFKEYDHVLYAHWCGATCKVSFFGNGATCNVASKAVTYGEPYGDLPFPNSRVGYAFVGWRLSSASNDERVTETTKVTTVGDHKLIAVWESCAGAGNFTAPEDGKTYDGGTAWLSFTETEGGGSIGRKQVSIRVPRGCTIGKYLYEPVSGSRVFQGWYREIDWQTGPTSGRISGNEVMPSENGLSLDALWSHYMIVFDYSTKVYRRPGEKRGEPPEPSQRGYTFAGWVSYAYGHYPYDKDGTVGYHDDWYISNWNANVYIVTFDADGGDMGQSSLTQKVVFDSAYGSLPEPTKDGYEFSCWKIGTTTVTSRTIVKTAEDHVLQACWILKYYRVTFDAAGGVCSEDSRCCDCGASCGDLPIPTRKGYSFDGWFTEDVGGVQIDKTNSVVQSTTYYAHWTPNQYVIAFNANGGSCSTLSKSVTYDSFYGTLPTPMRDGMEFMGWFTAKSNGLQILPLSKVGISSDQTLYARWVASTFAITFNANGGSCSESSRQCEYGASCGSLPTPTRTGYGFLGWFTASSGGTQISATTTVTGNMTVYAHWEANSYSVAYDPNSGSGSMAKTATRYDEMVSLTSTTFTRAGYRFAGWSTTRDGSVLYTNGGNAKNLTATKNATVTLYAIWEPAGIKVNYFRQRYPWNGLVDLEIAVTGDSWANYPATIQAVNGDDVALTVLTIGIGTPQSNGNPVTLANGTNHVVWGASADLGDGYKCDSVRMRAVLVTEVAK